MYIIVTQAYLLFPLLLTHFRDGVSFPLHDFSFYLKRQQFFILHLCPYTKRVTDIRFVNMHKLINSSVKSS